MPNVPWSGARYQSRERSDQRNPPETVFRSMKVAVLSYPMLFQTKGGLQIQVLETIAALNKLGCDARLIDPNRELMTEYNLVHLFSAIAGNVRIVEFARLLSVPVVLSPLIRPYWTRSLGRRARLGERLVGRLTNWDVRTEYREIHSALANSDRIVALGITEKQCIRDAFGIAAEAIEIIPNGIPSRFFNADHEPFLHAHKLSPGFVLNVASIDPHKNQLAIAQALSGSQRQFVLIGECHGPNRAYLDQILAMPNTRYIGSMEYDDPLLASAYAAAGVFCLTSHSEVMPLTVLESLAAGTPAVMTANHCMDTAGMEDCIIEVDPQSSQAILAAVERLLSTPPSAERCRQSVASLTWEDVGRRLMACYEMVLATRAARS